MVNILCIETSARACTIAVGREGQCISQISADGDFRHSKEITLLIDKCLSDSQMTIDDVSAVAISKGPGSYTGLRVGASCAKGICYALKLPLIAIDTLAIIAFPHLDNLTSDKDVVIPLIDARRMEVYWTAYNSYLDELRKTDNLVLESGCFDTIEARKIIFCGDGAHKIDSTVITHSDTSYVIKESIAEARYMVSIAHQHYMAQKFENLAYYVPYYLKPPNITKSKKKLV